MTQVKSLHLDQTDPQTDYLKVTFLNGDVLLLDTDVKEGVEGVLRDQANGEFDDLIQFYPADTAENVAKSESLHEYVLIFGE